MRLKVCPQVRRRSLCHETSSTALIQIKLQKLKEKDKKGALNEIRFLASIESPFVVDYKEAFYDEKSEMLCIVMECANEGDLQVHLPSNLASHKEGPDHQTQNIVG